MRRVLRRGRILFLAAWLLLMAAAPALAEDLSAPPEDEPVPAATIPTVANGTVYRSATEYDYPPFSVTESGEADGFSVELLKAVAAEVGIRIEFKIDEWNVIKEELRVGELDILPLVSYSEEREEYYDFSVPYIVMYGNIFVRDGDDSIHSEADLAGKRIAVMEGDTAHEYAVRMGFSQDLVLTPTFHAAFLLLQGGECDAVLAQSLVGEKIIEDEGLSNIHAVIELADDGVTRIKTRLSGFEQKFCFAVKEGDKELLALLNEGLAVVSVNGTYNRLYEKWFPFLLENQPTPQEILRYVAYILIPLLLVLLVAFNVAVRREVRRKTRELQSANEAKSRFLANMSHELRTPLNAILGYAELMQKEPGLSGPASRNLSIISKSGVHLLSLINDILEITKIESRQTEVRRELFDLHRLASDVEAMFQLEAESKRIRFAIEGLETVPRTLVGDSLKLRMVLINLVGNAVKFTEHGGVTVTFAAESTTAGERTIPLAIIVEDTGEGIAPEDMGKLFSVFSQTDSGRKSRRGTGLGLAISQESVRLMGGEIRVESRPGEGSRFSFTIPLEIAADALPREESDEPAGAYRVLADPPLRVLVAEDVEESRTLLVEILEKAGCEVLAAADGAEAVRVALAERPAFIWMDIRMPVMDGTEATRRIRTADPAYAPVIVALSAHVFEEEREQILAAGCDAVVGKPFTESELFRAMAERLEVPVVRETGDEDRFARFWTAADEQQRAALEDALLLLDQDAMLAVADALRAGAPEAAAALEEEIQSMNFTRIRQRIRSERAKESPLEKEMEHTRKQEKPHAAN